MAKFKPKQLQALDLLVMGQPILQVSEALEIPRSTLYLWLRDEDFKTEYDARLNSLVQYASGRLYRHVDLAIDRVRVVMELDPTESPQTAQVVFAASKYVIDSVHAARVLRERDGEEPDQGADAKVYVLASHEALAAEAARRAQQSGSQPAAKPAKAAAKPKKKAAKRARKPKAGS